MNFRQKKIGIWGLGISGTAALNYLLKIQHPHITVLDKQKKTPTSNSVTMLLDTDSNRKNFLNSHDIIIVSPGIDTRPYKNYHHKIVSEVDLFGSAWNQGIIAITGTLGKTSITTLLTDLLNSTTTSAVSGGNIGVGMLDLVEKNATTAVLELSSFQLEHAQTFAPDIAVWTNFYPNHLDRHSTIEEYFVAKKNILVNQQSNQKALVPLEIAEHIRTDHHSKDRPLALFCNHIPTRSEQRVIKKNDLLYYFDTSHNVVKKRTPGSSKTSNTILSYTAIPEISYKNNWLIIAAILDLAGHNAQQVIGSAHDLSLPHNRLELIATVNGLSFFNDSKATLMPSTLAAVEKLHNRHIVLLIGGTSKGVNRAPYIKKLTGKIHNAICFGTEAQQLGAMCKDASLAYEEHATLDSAVASAIKNAPAGAALLLSPGGASFDLFNNYEERGAYFKQLVMNYCASS